MKSHPKSVRSQLNLALLDRRPTELPSHEQHELALALVELLINAAAPGTPGGGGPNESETHE
ncbi:MAG: hypothetical protein DMG40_20460 [Acidobacteria bacterium]|nr:MAG: hypothetical protein DMG40_20460 [Acidobacteriota bacterium]